MVSWLHAGAVLSAGRITMPEAYRYQMNSHSLPHPPNNMKGLTSAPITIAIPDKKFGSSLFLDKAVAGYSSGNHKPPALLFVQHSGQHLHVTTKPLSKNVIDSSDHLAVNFIAEWT